MERDEDGRIPELSPDTAFEVLANADCRQVLNYLQDTSDNVASFESVVEHVAAQEQRGREEVATAIYHVALPKLVKARLIEYDDVSGDIRYWGHPLVEQCLDHAEEWE